GLGNALESRLNRLATSQDPRIQTFVNGMKEQLKT
ncbi:YscG family type III secretion system chaperone, partial [Enterobacter bugandensis]